MNETIDVNVKTLTPFTKILMTIGELPTSYLMSMTYYEQIIWFTKYLQDQVIPAINTNAEAVEELQGIVEALQEYIENLDIQEEVNNKIDEMVESGEFIQIISEYLGYVTPELFGAVADGETDDTTAIQNAMDYAGTTGLPLIFKGKTYKITSTLMLPTKINMDGKGATISLNANLPILSSSTTTKMNSSIIKGLNLVGANNENYTNNIGIYFAGIYCTFEEIQISYTYKGIEQFVENTAGNQVTCKFNNINIRYVTNNGIDLGSESNGKITDGWITNINIGCGGTGIKIGSAKGYFISNIHFWNNNRNMNLHDTAYTFINKIYSEGYNDYGFVIHLLGDVHINNVSSIATHDDSSVFYFLRSQNPVRGIYSINLSNITIGKGNDLTSANFITSENKQFPNVNYSNISLPDELTFTNSSQFHNPYIVLNTKEVLGTDVIDTTDGNVYKIKAPFNFSFQNYYKCKITMYGRRFNYQNFNASYVGECIIAQGGSGSNVVASLVDLASPSGFATDPSVVYNPTNKEIELSFKCSNGYPLCIFVEWFKED